VYKRANLPTEATLTIKVRAKNEAEAKKEVRESLDMMRFERGELYLSEMLIERGKDE
jgi:hypothetical protein